MEKQNPKNSHFPLKSGVLLGIILALFLYLTVDIFFLQIIEGSSEIEATQEEIILPERGSILDRQGQILAQSVDCYRVDLRPRDIPEEKRSEVAVLLSQVLGIPEEKITEKLATSDEPFPLSRQIDSEMAEKIKEQNLLGVDVLSSSQRVYPSGPMLSHILGFVHPDYGPSGREELFGLEGIEAAMESELHGHFGKVELYVGPDGEKLPLKAYEEVPVIRGKDITLTIDSRIQSIAESALEKTAQEKKAKSGCIIVIDVKNGEILAMASYPDFDPNCWTDSPTENLRNVATQFCYEPGSVLKFILGAAALEEDKIDPETIIHDNGPIEVGGYFFSCPSEFGGPHGAQNLFQLFKNSCNVGFIQIGRMLGIDTLLKYFDLFGLGQPSSIELPHSIGKIPPLEEWNDALLATASFGYGVEVTPLQLISAFQIVANDGKYCPLHLVKEIGEERTWEETAPSPRQVISQQTAIKLRESLKGVIEEKLPEGLAPYGVFGKTGTAQAWKDGGYINLNNTTFVGALPADNPSVAILVDINEPQVDFAYAVRVSVPVFLEVAVKIVDIMRFPIP